MQSKIVTLLYNNHIHHIDHLVPLSYILNIPVITNDDDIYDLISKYYPDIKSFLIDNSAFNIFLIKNFDNVITCMPRDVFDQDFLLQQEILNKKVNTIWCPHGNSDKGKTIPFMEALEKETKALVYGNKMIDFLKEKKVFHKISNIVAIGNYRYKYYLQKISFYKKIIKQEIRTKLPNQTTILYCPTWNDAENSSSFEKYYKKIIHNLPDHFNLIVKPHPNTLKTHATEITMLKYTNKQRNLLILDNFPIIYPLLDCVDIYLGDMSSVGYDFLTFNKPMFFFKNHLQSNLFDCGHIIMNQDNIFDVISTNLKKDVIYKKIRQKLYNYTFAKVDNLNEKIC